MQKSLFCICLLLAEITFAKSTVGQRSSYGYARTSPGSVGGGTYLSGRTGTYYGTGGAYYGSPTYYRSRCSGSNRGCGQDATNQETERLYAFSDGSCAARSCHAIAEEADCASAATATYDSSGVSPSSSSLSDTCPSNVNAKCYYLPNSNDVLWCSNGPTSPTCTTEKNCLCWCVIGTESSSVDVGLILGVTFAVLFGCCMCVGIWMYYAKQKKASAGHVSATKY